MTATTSTATGFCRWTSRGYFYKDIGHCLNHLPSAQRRRLLEGYCAVRPLPDGWEEAVAAFNIAARIEDHAHFFLNPDEPPGWEEGLARLARQACGAYTEGRFSLF